MLLCKTIFLHEKIIIVKILETWKLCVINIECKEILAQFFEQDFLCFLIVLGKTRIQRLNVISLNSVIEILNREF